MYYKVHTATKKAKIPISFVCEKCGKESMLTQELSFSKSYTDKLIFTEAQEEKKEERVFDSLQKKMEKAIHNVVAESEQKKYRTAKFSCRCPHCMHKPTWARMAYRKLFNFMKVLVYIFAGLAFMYLFAYHTNSMESFRTSGLEKTVYICAIALVGGMLGILLHRTIIESRIRKMDERYLPRIWIARDGTYIKDFIPTHKTVKKENPKQDESNQRLYKTCKMFVQYSRIVGIVLIVLSFFFADATIILLCSGIVLLIVSRYINKEYVKKSIYAVVEKMQEEKKQREENNDRVMQSGGWKCTCGRVNPSYTGTCACGKRKSEI